MATRASIPSISDIWREELRIRSVQALPDHRIKIVFLDGAEFELDLRPLVGKGEISDPLTNPHFFSKVTVGSDGRYIEWPNGYDIGSDTLRWDGELALRGLTRADVAPAK